MAVLGISSVGISHIAGAGAPRPAALKFGEVIKAGGALGQKPAGQAKPPVPVAATNEVSAQRPAARALDQVSAAQSRMDQVLELAQSGKTFTPAELLALQTQMYRASQELDLAGKVVEKATGGVKQVLQTQL
jgi:hypothetical protein